MSLDFAPITRKQAEECVRWCYETPYDLYNIPESDRLVEIAGMLDRANQTFAVISEGEFIGIRSFGADARVRGGNYEDEAYQDTGGALRPDLTGKGMGEGILRAGLQFGTKEFGFTKFRVAIAGFNQRAVKVCQRVGFVERSRFLRESDEREFIIFNLE